MYLYQDVFNGKYFEDYTTTLSLEPSKMSQIMYSANAPFTAFFNATNEQLFEHYNPLGICES